MDDYCISVLKCIQMSLSIFQLSKSIHSSFASDHNGLNQNGSSLNHLHFLFVVN